MPDMQDVIKTGPLYREFGIDRRAIDTEKRTVGLSFSSEEPVERWFGDEILDHSPGSVRLGRLSDGGAVLVGHDPDDHVGVVESVAVGKDRKGRSVVRFGRSQRAEEIFQDVQDGIRSKISVGYRIHELQLEKSGDDGDTYRATDWEPYEISIVSVPADATVGIGRGVAEAVQNECKVIRPRDGERDLKRNEDRQMPEAAASPEQSGTREAQAPTVNIEEVRNGAREAERARVAELLKLGREHNQAEAAQRFIEDGAPVGEFQRFVDLSRNQSPPTPSQAPINLDLNGEERNYSFLRAILACETGDWRKAGLEREVSEHLADRLNKGTRGVLVPTNLSVRAPLAAGVPAAIGYTVATEVMPLIDLLRNRMMVRRLGATSLAGLEGNLSFPRQDSAGSFYWVAENPGSDTPEDNPTVDQVLMAPKTGQAARSYTKQLLQQSSIDVENFVRADLMMANALGLDGAAINGTGASNQPTGIRNVTGVGLVSIGANGGAPTWQHIVDLETTIADANADVMTMGYLTTAKARGKLKTTEKAANTGQFIWTDSSEVGFGSLNGYRAAVSNQVPKNLTKGTGTNLSSIIFGDWSELMIGEWGVMELLTDPYTKSRQAAIQVTTTIFADIAVRHSESFAIIEDAVTT